MTCWFIKLNKRDQVKHAFVCVCVFVLQLVVSHLVFSERFLSFILIYYLTFIFQEITLYYHAACYSIHLVYLFGPYLRETLSFLWHLCPLCFRIHYKHINHVLEQYLVFILVFHFHFKRLTIKVFCCEPEFCLEEPILTTRS